ncbi:MAG: glycosyl hydrolase family 88, partial [Dysgonamonadaceae bacterium]|nr:glycosyl hydrolase family 88 [Dysgonamonadaceae bacterium]
MNKLLFTVLIVLFASACGTDNIDRTLQFSAGQTLALYHSVRDMPGRLPRSTNENGKLVTSDDAYWCSGFTAGTLWYLYEYTGCDSLKIAAETLTGRIERQQYTTDNHDVGFMINCSYGNGWRLTENPGYRDVIVNAARSL